MRNLPHDLRYALRMLARAPGFTAVAIASLALGIGANTAIFSLVYAFLLKPLPFRDPARLVAVWDTYQPLFPKLGISPPEYDALRRESRLFEQAAWYRWVSTDLNLARPGEPAVELHATIVSPELMPLLGVAPAVGRGSTRTRAAERAAQRFAVARALRRGPRAGRPHHTPGGRGIYGRRHHAAGISVPGGHRPVAAARPPHGRRNDQPGAPCLRLRGAPAPGRIAGTGARADCRIFSNSPTNIPRPAATSAPVSRRCRTILPLRGGRRC